MKTSITILGTLFVTTTSACGKPDVGPVADGVFSQVDPPSLDEPEPTPPEWECPPDDAPDLVAPEELTDLLQLVQVMSDRDPLALDHMCTTLRDTTLGPIEHSTGEDYPPDLQKRWAEVVARYWRDWDVTLVSELDAIDEPFRVAQSTIDAEYPCGEGPHGLVLCPTPAALPEGEVVMLAMILADDVPLADDTHSHQYAFVFDADGDPANDYVPDASYPFDFFAGTDYWLEALYDPASGWTARASAVLADGQVVTAFSWARIVIAGNTVAALVPRTELGNQSCPEHRMTAFTHLGDYGLQPPHVWMGDTEPTVDDGLEGTCE